MQSGIAEQREDCMDREVGLKARLLLGAYKTGRGALAAIGLNDSYAGRRIKGALNAFGAFLTRALLSSGKRHVKVQGQEMAIAGRRAPSAAFGLDMILGRYETEIVQWFEQTVKPGMSVLDLGAHVGFYTLLSAKLVGAGGKVYAFEPEPENFAVLSSNVERTQYRNVRLVHKAITDHAGTIDLYISPQGNDRHSVYKNPRSVVKESAVQVPTTSVDEFLAQENWPRIDVIKMDIEGAEPIGIRGMAKLLARSERLKLLIEYAPELLQGSGVAPDKFLSDLYEMGFELTSIEPSGIRRHVPEGSFSEFAKESHQRGAANIECDWDLGRANERSAAMVSLDSSIQRIDR